ncbi:hypothetical protein GCM10020227_60620 [Streptomyces flavovirens]
MDPAGARVFLPVAGVTGSFRLSRDGQALVVQPLPRTGPSAPNWPCAASPLPCPGEVETDAKDAAVIVRSRCCDGAFYAASCPPGNGRMKQPAGRSVQVDHHRVSAAHAAMCAAP